MGKTVQNTFSPTNDVTTPIDEEMMSVNIVVVGNRNVGKTSFIFRYTTGSYSQLYMPTISPDRKSKVVTTHDQKQVYVTLWDFSGTPQTPNTYGLFSRANGFLVMYDVTDVQSYNDIFHWMELIEANGLSSAHVVMVANKTDMRVQHDDDAIVNKVDVHLRKQDGLHVAECYGAKFMETSVSTNRNVEKTIRRLVTNICRTKKFY